jgi:hypothetical protein
LPSPGRWRPAISCCSLALKFRCKGHNTMQIWRKKSLDFLRIPDRSADMCE